MKERFKKLCQFCFAIVVFCKQVYLVKDGEYTPQFVYGERQVVSAIMEISGMCLCGNTVRYRIDQK